MAETNHNPRPPGESASDRAASPTFSDDSSLPFFDHPRFQEIYKGGWNAAAFWISRQRHLHAELRDSGRRNTEGNAR